MNRIRLTETAQLLEASPPEIQELEFRRVFGDTNLPLSLPLSLPLPLSQRGWLRFLQHYTWTQDEHDEANPFKPLVSSPDELPYLPLFGLLYLTIPLLASVKSRQVRITWIASALDIWRAMAVPGRRIVLSAQGGDEADAILARCATVYQHLPPSFKSRCPARTLVGSITFSNGSRIEAFPSGEEQFRLYTVSVWRNEEARAQANLRETLTAALPTLQGGGHGIQISTPGPGEFENIILDIDPTKPGFDPLAARPEPLWIRDSTEATPPDLRTPYGTRVWKNAGNGYTVFEVHYSADPSKDPRFHPEFIDGVRQTMPHAAVQQEYELDFRARFFGSNALVSFITYRDRIVFDPNNPDDPRAQRLEQLLSPDFGLLPGSRVVGLDYGIKSPYAAVWGVYDPDTNHLYIYDEYYAAGFPLPHHLAEVKRIEALHVSASGSPVPATYVLDRSCFAATQQVSYSVEGQTVHGVRSIAEMHRDKGIYPLPAKVVFDAVKVEALESAWGIPAEDPLPAIFISLKCAALIRELELCRWLVSKSANASHSPQRQKLVDQDNHAFDCACYMVLHRPPSSGDHSNDPATSRSRPSSCRSHEEEVKAFLVVQAEKAAEFVERSLSRASDPGSGFLFFEDEG